MRKPALKNLSVNEAETKSIRAMAARQKSIKITININADSLRKLKTIAAESGVPYQRLINRALTESLATRNRNNTRLDRLEKELAALKKKIAA